MEFICHEFCFLVRVDLSPVNLSTFLHWLQDVSLFTWAVQTARVTQC